MWISQMADNVLSFSVPEEPKEEPELVLQCPCGSVTFYQYIRGDGNMECCTCGEIILNDLALALDFSRVDKMDDELLVKRTMQNPVSDIAQQRIVNSVNSTTKVLIVIDEDGVVRTWSVDPENPEESEWLRQRIAEAEKLIC